MLGKKFDINSASTDKAYNDFVSMGLDDNLLEAVPEELREQFSVLLSKDPEVA